jgi:GntR family transcriptional regulator
LPVDPMYRSIAEDLRARIELGRTWPTEAAIPPDPPSAQGESSAPPTSPLFPGSQLPTELELRDSYNASRNTIRDALKLLIGRGLIETRPGQGTFVVEKFEPFMTTLSSDWQEDSGLGGGEGHAALAEVKARHRTADASDPQVGTKKASGYVADRLQVSEGASVISRHQERSIDGQRWSLQTSYYPFEFATRGAAKLLEPTNIDEGTVTYLARTLGLKQVGYRDLIAVRAPDENEIKFFRLPDDSRIPVFVLLRTGFARGPDTDGVRPFRLTESVFPCDRNQFVINAGEVPDRLGSAADV